jgi:phosphatidylethanolamine/phosphatidyl-N-methylethanolamine N-methyltransferase
MPRDFAVFIGQVIRRPREISAIAPSSATVARAMTQDLEHTTGPIVEIGPGTGVFTKAILERGVAPERLTLMEMNPVFCENLRQKFPGVTVLNRPGEEIADIGLTGISAVISGVPMLARPQLQRMIVGPALRVLAANGTFVQFTYSPNSPITETMQEELGVSVEKRATVWANLPPARVFVFRSIQH